MRASSMFLAAGALLGLLTTPAAAQDAAPPAVPASVAPASAPPADASGAGGVGATTPPPPAGASPDDVARWRAAYINPGRSALIGATAEAVEYAVGGTVDIRPENRVRAWMRWEAFRPLQTPEGEVRSYTELVEVDCGDQRARLLAMDTFAFNNLQGSSRHHDAQDAQWAYPRPNSALEAQVKTLCGVRDVAMLQLAAAAAAQAGGQPGGPSPKPGLSTFAMAGAAPK